MKATAALPDERVTIHWKLRAGKNFVEASGISYIIAEKDLYQEPQIVEVRGFEPRTPCMPSLRDAFRRVHRRQKSFAIADVPIHLRSSRYE
jgi:hypothetical protein